MAHLHLSSLSRHSLGLMKSALLGASTNGDSETVQECVCYKELIDACDPKGRIALHLAAIGGHANIVHLLLKRNVPVDISIIDLSGQDRKAGWTALHCAVDGGHYEVVTVLLGYQASLHAADKNGNTPLHLAANQQTDFMFDIINALLTHGALTTKRNNRNQTPLDVAIKSGNELVIDVLLDWQSRTVCPTASDERCEEQETPCCICLEPLGNKSCCG